jgi:hypothetical protein
VAGKLGEGGHGPAAECIAALARAQQKASGPTASDLEVLEGALPALRSAGASRMLAMVLVRAARLELSAHRTQPSDDRGQRADTAQRIARAELLAREALAAALRVERASEIVEARALLAEIAVCRGDPGQAREELEALAGYARSPDLSAKSVAALRTARALVLHSEGD